MSCGRFFVVVCNCNLRGGITYCPESKSIRRLNKAQLPTLFQLNRILKSNLLKCVCLLSCEREMSRKEGVISFECLIQLQWAGLAAIRIVNLTLHNVELEHTSTKLLLVH